MKYIVILMFLVISTNTKAQDIDMENLYSTWVLDKYSNAEQYYKPPKKETGDYFTLKKDMTYASVSEGKASEGNWIYNANGKYLELKGEGGKEKIYIHFLSDKTLVVTYDTDEYRVWEVHYVSCSK